MEIPTAIDLEYLPVSTEGWPESLICCCCGKPLPQQERGCYMAQVEIADSATVDFHFCSQKCVDDFRQHPVADYMIRDVVGRSLKLYRSGH